MIPTETQPTPIAAVLFDFGLVLTAPPHPPAWARMREITGLADDRLHHAYWVPRRAYDRGTHTGAEYWRAVGTASERQFSDSQIAALLEADIDLWTQPNPPMVAWAARLQAAGTPTGVLSNLGDHMRLGVLDRLPWLAAFDHALWSHQLGLIKPELTIYQRAIDRFCVSSNAILFLDDRPENIAGARAAGMQTIQYTGHDAFLAAIDRRNLTHLWHTGQLTPHQK